ncbi:N-acetylneuraminate synthase [Cognatishimia sp. 1_MG-2023]|uniref:N-acetylneuraminate synthase n=1 Tax=Cognatishimia sp. 1_MG-2023 TaxID=3062642 RepID=UPI0026E417A0|nr:N-acetylneuraminate synthase [Cognatishimia sp. 1_MG-2023]MDO6728357.1 N-acetylneuraminate synthase [Cognatishimia sp. 1_MG-2023]
MGMFFIAEAGVNHNGSLKTALDLIDAAAEAGADAVKFQTFKAGKTVASGTKTVDYQRDNTDTNDQLSLLKRLELSAADHEVIAQHCSKMNIEFMSTAFDEDSAVFLNNVGISRLKIPSGEVSNLSFIRFLAGFNLPIILSTGMATLEEVGAAVEAIRSQRLQNGFTAPLNSFLSILHCTSAYPTPDDQLNLRAIQTLRKAFNVPVGYSDHSAGQDASLLTVALGAAVYEKHFTLDRNMTGPDHKASLEPCELKEMIARIRVAETMLGTGEKKPQPCELQARDLVRRSICAARDLKAGETISKDDLIMLRPALGLAPEHHDSLLGKVLSRDIPQGGRFESNDL